MLSLLDVLGYREEIPICTAYRLDGQTTTDFPLTPALDRARPVLETLPGWQCDVSGIREFADLPAAAQRYVRRIEELIEAPVRWVSVGPHREAMIEL